MENRKELGAVAGIALVLAMVCLHVSPAAHLWAQERSVDLPPADSPTTATPHIAGSSSALPLIVRGPCDPNYWIVSSRCCRQQVENGEPCAYRVYRFDGLGGGRGADLEELYGTLQPGVPVCFMAHGSFVEWDSMLDDCANTYRWIRQAAPHHPLNIIFYTWPSDDSSRLIPTLDVNKMGRRAEQNGLYLAELISRVSNDHYISLIGHSHGARMISAAVHALAGGLVEGRYFSGGPQWRHRIRLVLAAAAIDHDWYNPGGRFELALHRAESVLNLQNRRDFALQFYPSRRLFSSRALGITGVTRLDRRLLGVQNCRIEDCDVTPIVGLGHVWAHYYQQPDIAQMIRHFIYFDESP